MENASLRMTLFAAMGAVLLVLGGCSTVVHVTSDPEGATISDASGTVIYGIAPVNISYNKKELEYARSPGACAMVPGLKATWKSGATSMTPEQIPLCDLSAGVTIALERPKDAPGEIEDLKFALELAQSRARAAQLEAERERLYNDRFMWGGGYWGGQPGWGMMWSLPIAPPPPPPPSPPQSPR